MEIITFDRPISFTPKDLTNSLSFANGREFLTWTIDQMNKWNNLPRTNISFGDMNPVDLLVERYRTLHQIISNFEHNPNLTSQIINLVSLIENGSIPTTETPRGKQIILLAKHDPKTAAALIALDWNLNQNNGPYYTGITSAYALQGALNNSEAEKEAQKETFLDLKKDMLSQFETLIKTQREQTEANGQLLLDFQKDIGLKIIEYDALLKQFTSHNDNRQESLEKEDQTRKEEWASLKAAYTTEMQLRASVTYWNEKRRNHERRSENNIKLFCGVGFVVTAIIIAAAYLLFEAVLQATWLLQVRASLLIFILLFLEIWGLKLISRRIVANQNLADDAAERTALVHAFKALEKEGKADNAERLLILQALFRPAAHLSDDTAPISLIEKMINRS